MSSAVSISSSAEVKYFLKFAINVPMIDVKRMIQTNNKLLYSLKDCSRAGRVNWKIKIYRNQPIIPDSTIAVYLKFEPQCNTDSVKCCAEFLVRVTGKSGEMIERQSSNMREFTKEDDCWGWSQFGKLSELEDLICDIDGQPFLKFSGVIRIFDTSKLLYPHRRHNFARSQNGSDFRIKVGMATFHVHKSILSLNSDYFASLFSHDCLETTTGQILLQDEKIQDIHLLLQCMYPGYSDVLDDSTLVTLSSQASKYFVHTLTWRCMHYVDSRLGEAVDAERAMKYYHVCLKNLQCNDLSEQCIKAASFVPWSKIKDTSFFKNLDECEKAAFLQRYLDFKEERRRTPMPTPSRKIEENFVSVNDQNQASRNQQEAKIS